MTPNLPRRLRSVLFAPAVRPDFLTKLPTRGADAVVIDCEDATPAANKAEARVAALSATPELAAAGCQVMVRVNSPGSEWLAGDIAEGLAPELAAVMVPKVEQIAELDAIAGMLESASLGTVGVCVGIETALGVADARSILSHPLVVAAYFGAEDLVADMGGVRTPGNQEVAFARSSVALAARLAGIPVVDQVVTDFSDSDRFTREASEARALGFAGKLCIHPAQVELANDAFTPSVDEVDRARRLIAAYEERVGQGVAAIAFEGQMVDEALVRQARRVLNLAS